MAQSAVEREFTDLRLKLEALGYTQPVGIESVPLVKALLNEVIKTAELYEKKKNEAARQKEQVKKEKAASQPLKNENMKLVEENNDLHKELIRLKEIQDLHDITQEEAVSKFKAEAEEVKFLLIEKESKIKGLQLQNDKIQKKLNEVISKVYGDASKTGLKGATKILNMSTPTNIIGSKSSFSVTQPLAEAHFSRETLERNTLSKQAWADEIRGQEDRFEKLDKDKRVLERRLEQALKFNEMVQQQKNKLEIEVKRVMESYNVTDRLEEMKMKYDNDHQSTEIEKLNAQIDFLNRENHDLREQAEFAGTKGTRTEVLKLERQITKLKKEKENLKNQLKEANNDQKSLKSKEKETFEMKVLL